MTSRIGKLFRYRKLLTHHKSSHIACDGLPIKPDRFFCAVFLLLYKPPTSDGECILVIQIIDYKELNVRESE